MRCRSLAYALAIVALVSFGWVVRPGDNRSTTTLTRQARRSTRRKWTILDSTNTTFYVNDPTAPSQLLPYDTGHGSGWIRSTSTWSGNTDFAFQFPSNSDTFFGGMAIHLGITNAANGPAGSPC